MPEFSGKWSGQDSFHASMARIRAAADEATREALTVVGASVVKKAQHNFSGAHAKGKPHEGGDKPNVVTGYLRRSIEMTPLRHEATGFWALDVQVGAIYGRRVEKGFYGRDSLGRIFAQRAYPYFDPAAHDAMDTFAPLAAAIYAKHFAHALTA